MSYNRPEPVGQDYTLRRIRWVASKYHLAIPLAALVAERTFTVMEVR